MGERAEWIDCDGQHEGDASGDEQRGVWWQRGGNPVAKRHGIGGGVCLEQHDPEEPGSWAASVWKDPADGEGQRD